MNENVNKLQEIYTKLGGKDELPYTLNAYITAIQELLEDKDEPVKKATKKK